MTTLEKELISKSFYQTLIKGSKAEHPVKALGELFMDEREKELPDLSAIRFAQGEIYFLNKDYESAIFKWETVSNELKPWALKNLGDAHIELDLLAIADDYYSAVETDSEVLKIEVLLQQFSLYLRLDKPESAVDSIKKAVSLNPDYPDVTTLARAFFEESEDWDNAIELAVNEAVRLESLSWFEVLEGYIEKGYAGRVEPNYFNDSLITLYHIDQAHFEDLVRAIWKSYKNTDLYFSWLKEINNLLGDIEPESPYSWKKLSLLYKEAYFDLISGKYLIKEFSHLIPDHLTNWLKLSTLSDAAISASAVFSWNEVISQDFPESVVSEAEAVLKNASNNGIAMDEALQLFESVRNWARQEGVLIDEHIELLVGELLDLNNYHLIVSGAAPSGQSTFVNQLLDEDRLAGLSLTSEISATVESVKESSNYREFRQMDKSRQALIPCKLPVGLSTNNNLSLKDAPVIFDQRNLDDHLIQYLNMSDALLFAVNVDLHLSGRELDMAVRLKEYAPDLPIHFLLWKSDRIANSQISMELVEKTVSRIEEYFPNAAITAFSAYDDSESQLKELSAFASSVMEGYKLEEERTSRILYSIRKTIKFLLMKRVELEKSIMDKIEWKEEIAAKLEGAHNQLNDIVDQKAKLVKSSFGKILDELDKNMISKIPELLRNCSEMVNENSDLGKIHVELNDEMNRRISSFIEDSALPEFKGAIEEWIQDCEREFRDSQNYLDELAESFNQMYGEEKVILGCDFQVLHDWRRDVDRMTRGNIELEKVNILLRSTPSQLLFKGAGKLFGALSKNNELLHNKYKHFIETKDYSGMAEMVTDKFIQQFELFERSLERDTSMFFSNPIEALKKSLDEAREDIEEKKETLSNIRENPEIYRDPLTLFELKLRQYDQINGKNQQQLEYR